jgi:hypothetical protein
VGAVPEVDPIDDVDPVEDEDVDGAAELAAGGFTAPDGDAAAGAAGAAAGADELMSGLVADVLAGAPVGALAAAMPEPDHQSLLACAFFDALMYESSWA